MTAAGARLAVTSRCLWQRKAHCAWNWLCLKSALRAACSLGAPEARLLGVGMLRHRGEVEPYVALQGVLRQHVGVHFRELHEARGLRMAMRARESAVRCSTARGVRPARVAAWTECSTWVSGVCFQSGFCKFCFCVFSFCSKEIFLKVIVANGRSSANTLWAVAPTARGSALEDWEGSGGRASERGEEVGRRASFLLKFNQS